MKGLAYPGAIELDTTVALRVLNFTQALDECRLNVGYSVPDPLFLSFAGPEETGAGHKFSHGLHSDHFWQQAALQEHAIDGHLPLGLPEQLCPDPRTPVLRASSTLGDRCHIVDLDETRSGRATIVYVSFRAHSSSRWNTYYVLRS